MSLRAYFSEPSGVSYGEKNGAKVGVRSTAVQQDTVSLLPDRALGHTDAMNGLKIHKPVARHDQLHNGVRSKENGCIPLRVDFCTSPSSVHSECTRLS